MYIQPNTTVRLLTGVPLDNTYAHTLYFANKSSQTSYFESKTKAGCLLSNLSYQRYTKGSLRIQKLADDIYDCNYMMFQNTAYGNKWFYAFINNIEYVSNTVCEITYEIDVIQTWFFDVTLLQSFVEREHSATDVAGDNIIPESVPIGELYQGEPISTQLFDSFDIIIVSPYTIIWENTTDSSGEYVDWSWGRDPQLFQNARKYVDNQVTALNYVAFNSTNDEFDDDELVHYNGYKSFLIYMLSKFPDINDIACAYLIPHDFINYRTDSIFANNKRHYMDITEVLPNEEPTTVNHLKTYTANYPTALCHGYVPKNKKLLTYPYNKFVIDTADGNTYEYPYEFFEKRDVAGHNAYSVTFNIMGYRGINCAFRCVPRYYKGEYENFSESCLLTDFPNVGLITDSFKAWVAQNKTRVALQTATDVLGVGSGLGAVMAGSQIMTPRTKVLSLKGAKMMAGGYDEVGKSGVRGIGQTIAELTDRSKLRYHPKVGSNDGSTEIVWNKKDFTGMQYSVNPQNARIIDDFFNCYGYATHRVKVPNRNVRPHWTYVKTIDINLESNAPSDDTSKIASIYDNGITFWRNPSEVGNYSLDNSPR